MPRRKMKKSEMPTISTVAPETHSPLPTPSPLTGAAAQEVQEQQRILSLPEQRYHAAGIDVGDRSHWVCVRQTPDNSDCTREFPAHTPGLKLLIRWLKECKVSTVAMEASGVYGHILFTMLQEAGFQVLMTAPQFARQIKGRPKTDRLDCQWIQRLHQLGLLPTVFQPDDATMTLRAYVRQRANLVRLSGEHIQRMQKALILMNLKLTQVLGDITGVTGRKIIDAILNGVRDPLVLSKLRDRRCKHTEEEIATALTGCYRDEHVMELRLCYRMWQEYQKVIADLDKSIADHMKKMGKGDLPPLPKKPRVRGRKPHDPQFDVREALYRITRVDLTEIEGIDEIHALTLISELGCDFTKWPSVKHFASWLGLCPQFKKTGGKVKSSRTRKGKNRAAHALRMAAWSLMRSKSYLGAFLRRKRGHLGAPKAITATAHKLARILYNLMRFGLDYVKKTEEEFIEENRERQEKNLHRRAKELGYELKKIEPLQEDASVPTTAV